MGIDENFLFSVTLFRYSPLCGQLERIAKPNGLTSRKLKTGQFLGFSHSFLSAAGEQFDRFRNNAAQTKSVQSVADTVWNTIHPPTMFQFESIEISGEEAGCARDTYKSLKGRGNVWLEGFAQ